MPNRAICAFALSLLVPATACAAFDELLGKYATTKEFCADAAMQGFEIRRGVIEGPGFLCILGAPQPATTGLDAYEAKCKQQDGVHLGALRLDLSAKGDHIAIMLPENQDWIALYPCK